MAHSSSTYLLGDEPIELNPGRPRTTLTVSNSGDRAIQVGSHFHFFEVNRALRFDRAAAFGLRLDIPSGTATRFEPGDTRDVTLIPFGGTRRAVGFIGLVNGSVAGDAAAALRRAAARGFLAGADPARVLGASNRGAPTIVGASGDATSGAASAANEPDGNGA